MVEEFTLVILKIIGMLDRAFPCLNILAVLALKPPVGLAAPLHVNFAKSGTLKPQ